MCRINERTFVERILKLNGKRIVVEVEGIVKLEVEQCNIVCSNGIVKIKDKANKNVITINMSFAHTIIANNQNNEFQVYCDNDVLFTIEELQIEQEKE